MDGELNGCIDTSHVKNEAFHNTPIVIEETLSSSGITLIALWDILADTRYRVSWPEDRRLPLSKDTVIAVYTRQGHGEIHLHDGSVIEPHGHSVVFLKPTTIAHYCCPGMLWDLVWIEMVPNGALTFPFRSIISLSNEDRLINECAEAIELLSREPERWKSLGVAMVTKLIYQWLAVAGDPLPASANLKRVERVLEALHQSMNRCWTVTEMAAIAQCSEQQLRKLFHTYTGQSPKRYLINAKLDIARVLLNHKRLNVAEVAEKLGFHDSFHFSKAFKQRFGQAPSAHVRRPPQSGTQ